MRVMCFVNQYTLEHPIVIVNDNGEFIERTKAVLSMIPEAIVELCDKYNIHEVGLGGLHSYVDYIKIGIEEEQITKYGKNDVIKVEEIEN